MARAEKRDPGGRGTDGIGWRTCWPEGREPRGLPDTQSGLGPGSHLLEVAVISSGRDPR